MDEERENQQRECLREECLNIIEDCDCERKKLWNERDKLNDRVDRVKGWVALIRGVEVLLGSGAVLQTFKSISNQDWPISLLSLIVLIMLTLFETFFSPTQYQSWADDCHKAAANFYSLRVQVNRFCKLHLPYLPISDVESKVIDMHNRKLSLCERGPQRVFCPKSWPEAQASIKRGDLTYTTEKDH